MFTSDFQDYDSSAFNEGCGCGGNLRVYVQRKLLYHPLLDGGGNSPKMLGIALFDQFNRYLDYNRSAALSVIMFLLCSVSAVVYIYTNLKENDWEK